MRDCPNAEIRDLLPDFVHASLGDADVARVTAHVASCADCRAELALLRSAAAALRTRPVVDVAAIVRALPAPPAAAPRLVLEGSRSAVAAPRGAPARWRRGARWTGVAAAAAAIIAVVTARGLDSEGEQSGAVARGAGGAPAAAVVPEVGTRGGAGTGPVTAPPAAGGAPSAQLAMTLGGGPIDLSDGELETLLGDLEAMDAMPSAEPEEQGDPLREGGEEFR